MPVLILILITSLLNFKSVRGVDVGKYNIAMVCSEKTSRDVKVSREPRGSRDEHKDNETVLSVRVPKWF